MFYETALFLVSSLEFEDLIIEIYLIFIIWKLGFNAYLTNAAFLVWLKALLANR